MGLETAGTIAGIAAGTTSTGAGLATIFGSSGGGEGRPLRLPPELEATQLDIYRGFLADADTAIKEGFALIPKLEERLDVMDRVAQQATPDPSQIQRINQIDQEIAERFGRGVSADVKAGIITDEAKTRTIELQKQIKAELEAQGKFVDDRLAIEIQQAIRNRVGGGSLENQALDEIGKQLLDEVKGTGSLELRKDPRIENQLKVQEDALRSRLRSQFGPDYENTTQGSRALKDFYQGATETRFGVHQQLQTSRIQNLSSLIETRDTGLLRNVEVAKGTQELAAGRIKRLSDLGTTITNTLQPVIQSEILETERAKVALAAGQNLREGFKAGLSGQADILRLRELPFNLRQRLLENRAATFEAGARLGQFEFSGETKDALRFGNVPGFQGRGSIYGESLATKENKQSLLSIYKEQSALNKNFGQTKAGQDLYRRIVGK